MNLDGHGWVRGYAARTIRDSGPLGGRSLGQFGEFRFDGIKGNKQSRNEFPQSARPPNLLRDLT